MNSPKILHITTWYPNETDPQLGIFIQKHIHIGHSFAQNVVIALIASDKIKTSKLITKNENGITEIIGYYKVKKGKKWSNYKNQNHIITKIFQHFLTLNFKPDFVHCHVSEKSIKIAQKFFSGFQIILTQHWSGFLNGNFELLSTSKQKQRIKEINACKNVVCVSEFLKNALIMYGVTSNIQVIPNIIENKGVKEAFNQNFKFLVVADLVDKIKNISGIIRAFNTLNNKNHNASLTIIGDGIDRENLEELVNSNSKIEFLGRKDNDFVLQTLPTYDCLLVNSFHETFSMITAETLLSGVPVIATQCGGPEQFIENGVNGFLVEINKPFELEQAMLKMLNNHTSFIPQNISENISKRLSISSVRKQFENLYSEKLLLSKE